MRLIDADKLEVTAVLGVQLQHADSGYYYFCEQSTIDNAPTVEAIPKEWIENYVRNKFCLADWYGGFIGGINMMLEDWEEENAKEEL